VAEPGQQNEETTSPGMAEYEARIRLRRDRSLGMEGLIQYVNDRVGRSGPAWIFPLTLFGGVSLLSIAVVNLGNLVFPFAAACISGIVTVVLIELFRSFDEVRDRLVKWCFTLKLFSGEITDDLFSQRSCQIADSFFSRKGKPGLARTSVLFALEMGRFIEAPSSALSIWLIVLFAVVQLFTAIYACAVPLMGYEHSSLLFGILFATVLIEFAACAALNVIMRVFFMLDYLKTEARRLHCEITGMHDAEREGGET